MINLETAEALQIDIPEKLLEQFVVIESQKK